MGLDTSAHPFDVKLLQERIIPFVLEGAPIDDLIDQAVRKAVVSSRVGAWALAVTGYDRDLYKRQADILKPERDAYFAAYDRQQKKGLFSRLFGKKGGGELPPFPRDLDLNGFDTDLMVWGRPFFMDGDSPQAVCDLYERYVSAAGAGTEEAEAVVAEVLARLEEKRLIRPDDARDDLWAVIAEAPPLTSVRPQTDEPPANADALRAGIEATIACWCAAAVASDPTATVYHPANEEEIAAADIHYMMPHEIVNFLSLLMPGWMGRGYGFGSNLLDMVGCKEPIFETPEAAFAPLAARMPEMKKGFSETIPENFSLGGYIPPERVGRFIELLEEHRLEMILAFEKDQSKERSEEEIDALQNDWLRLREAAECAHRRGYGYIEGAEIYSGPLGMMN